MIEVSDSLIMILGIVLLLIVIAAVRPAVRELKRWLPWVFLVVAAWWVYSHTNVLTLIGVTR